MSLLLPSHGPGSTPDGEYAYPRELNGLIGRGHPLALIVLPATGGRNSGARFSAMRKKSRRKKSRSLLVPALRRLASPPKSIRFRETTDPTRKPRSPTASGL